MSSHVSAVLISLSCNKHLSPRQFIHKYNLHDITIEAIESLADVYLCFCLYVPFHTYPTIKVSYFSFDAHTYLSDTCMHVNYYTL